MDDDDDDDLVWRLEDVIDCVAACLLIARGRLARPAAKTPMPYNEWARERADPGELDAACAEVRAMTPEQRGLYLRLVMGGFDA